MDESPSAGPPAPSSPPVEPPAPSPSPQAAPPPGSPGKRRAGTFLVTGVMIGLAIGAVGILVRGSLKRGAAPRANATVVERPAAGGSDGAESGPDGGNGADVDLVPDVDPVLFRNQLDAASGGTKPVWQDGAQATLVDFWASWCGPCLQELPHLQELQERVEARGMRVVLVNVDLGDAKSTGGFLRRKGVLLDSLVDRDAVLFQTIGLEALPSTFVLDAKGRPVTFFEGGASREELEAALLRANQKHVRESYR